jgi:hypothetical protein
MRFQISSLTPLLISTHFHKKKFLSIERNNVINSAKPE